MFEKGKRYLRKELHDKYGGNRQSGISKSRKYKIIMLFTSERGKEFGYEDGWKEGFFLYCGEGQSGDMEFVRGNKAIRDHQIEGYSLHLFKSVPEEKGFVEYIGQFVCVGYEIKEGYDREGKKRKAIIFKLMPYEEYIEFVDQGIQNNHEFSETSEDFKEMDFKKIRELAYGKANIDPEKRSTKREYIKRSKIIREYALKRAEGHCEYCGSEAPFYTKNLRPYLEVHHIYRLSDGGPDDPRWVIALCPNCHRRAHFSKDAEKVKEEMAKIVLEKELDLDNS